MKPNIIRCDTHEKWLAQRAKGIGSSDVATIMGVNPYCTPWQLWARRKGVIPPQSENVAMLMGHLLEDAVAKRYAIETGARIIKNSAGELIYQDSERPYLQASPDRLYYRAGDKRNLANRRILECKTTARKVDADDVPDYWFCQLQYQMGIAQIEGGALAWLVQGRDFGYKDIAFDRGLYSYMAKAVAIWWAQYIEGDDEPTAEPQDAAIKYREVRGNTAATASSQAIEAYGTLLSIRSQIKVLEEAEEEVKQLLRLEIADSPKLVDNIGNVLATLTATKGRKNCDFERLANDFPEAYKQCVSVKECAPQFRVK